MTMTILPPTGADLLQMLLSSAQSAKGAHGGGHVRPANEFSNVLSAQVAQTTPVRGPAQVRTIAKAKPNPKRDGRQNDDEQEQTEDQPLDQRRSRNSCWA